MDETPYVETLEPGGSGGSPDGAGGSKLPPVLANLMGSMGAGKGPQGPGGGGINVQEILTSIMVCALFPLFHLLWSLLKCSLLTLVSHSPYPSSPHLPTYPNLWLSLSPWSLPCLSVYFAFLHPHRVAQTVILQRNY